MGNTSSRISGKISVKSYKNVKLPVGYKLFKISTYNINLSDCLSLDDKINDVMKYINNEYKDLQHDIVCLQGINDESVYNKLLYEILNTYRKDISIIPVNDKMRFNNVIISFHPFKKIYYNKYLKNKIINQVFGNNSVIGANVNIHGNIISIFTTELIKDIRSSGLEYSVARQRESEELFKYIDNNLGHNLCLVLGSINIDEYVQNGQINNQYKEFIEKYKLTDLYRKFNSEKGSTNNFNTRDDYIFVYNCPNIYSQYGIHNIECYIRTDMATKSNSQNYPTEAVFMVMDKS